MTEEQRRRLRETLTDLPGIIDPGGRYNFLTEALYNYPRSEKRKILRQINFSGPATTYTSTLLTFLETFGDEGEALAIFLNSVAEEVSEKDAKFIRSLIEQSGTTDWKGVDTPGWIQEKIIGENTLEPFYRIARILEAGAAVAWIESPGTAGAPRQRGSGFLVADDLILTNNHVLPSRESAAESTIRFNYDQDIAGSWQTLRFKPDGVFITDDSKKHDCTLIQLETPVLKTSPLVLNREPVFVGGQVPIIQHPLGEIKQIAQRDNFIAYLDDIELQYTTSTEPGSSGSPVFNREYQVIGLHSGVRGIADSNTKKTYYRNRGTRIGAVLKALRIADPTQYAKCINAMKVVGD